jgi:hypothetical protein
MIVVFKTGRSPQAAGRCDPPKGFVGLSGNCLKSVVANIDMPYNNYKI